jgi:arylamine N-acetyltransferase
MPGSRAHEQAAIACEAMIESGGGHAMIALSRESLHALTALGAGGQVEIAPRMHESKRLVALATQSKYGPSSFGYWW